MTDFEILEAALTGWDNPEPLEVPPAREALNRLKKLHERYREALEEISTGCQNHDSPAAGWARDALDVTLNY